MTVSQIEQIPLNFLIATKEEVTRALTSGEPIGTSFQKTLLKRLKELLVAHDITVATKLLIFWIINDKNCVEIVRREGVLRPSKCDFWDDLRAVAETCLNLDWLLDEHDRRYFDSVRLLVEISNSVRNATSEIDRFILANRKTFLKTIVVFADLLFMHNYRPENDPATGKHYSTKEDVADAISFLIFRFTTGGKISLSDFNWIDEQHIFKKRYWNIISLAISIRKYQEFEISVEAFGFHIEKRNTRYELAHVDETFRRSIGLGYAFTELHKHNQIVHGMSASGKIGSLFDFSEQYYDGFKKQMFELAIQPIRRYRMLIVDAPPFWKLFQADGIYIEDLVSIEELQLDLHATFDEILSFKFGTSLTVFDILKVRRLFYFLRHCFGRFLKEKQEKNYKLVARSLVPVFKKELFKEILEKVIGTLSAVEFIDLYGWDLNSFFDFQYQPIIASETHYMIPINVTGTANLVRNLLMKQRRRLFPDGTIDPLTRRLRVEFEKKGGTVLTDVTYSFGAFSGDIDLVSVLGEHVFFFEAKNSLLPASTTEQRTSYDYILKAGKQLEQLQNLMADGKFVEYLGKRTGVSFPVNTKKVYSIVSGNRLFLGHRERGFPVVFLNELCNAIDTGTVILSNARYHIFDPTIPIDARIAEFILRNPLHIEAHKKVEMSNVEFDLGEIVLGDQRGYLNIVDLSEATKAVVFGEAEKV